jgi:hypothetical protein
MIRRIILENYMAHGRTMIEPAAGLTVLVGPNNCGKSAVAHALQTLCYNKPADFAVRHGEKEASVTVETDDGHVLTWRRRKNVVSYVIDGREIGRLGQAGVPEDLHRYLRMPRIDPPNESGAPFYVHFGLQKSPIFLLDDPPARAATFFASSSDAEKLLEMQKRHREKVKDARRDQDRLTSEGNALDRRLEATASIGDLAERMTELQQSHARLTESDRGVAARKDLLNRLDRSRKQRERHQARVLAAQLLLNPPTLADTGPLSQIIMRFKRTDDRLRRDAFRSSAVVPLQLPPAWKNTTALRQLIDKLDAAAVTSRRAGVVLHGVTPLNSPPEEDRQKSLSLASLIIRCRELTARRAAAKAELLMAHRDLDALGQQVRAWIEQHPNCPTCGAPTRPDTVLELEHQHA